MKQASSGTCRSNVRGKRAVAKNIMALKAFTLIRYRSHLLCALGQTKAYLHAQWQWDRNKYSTESIVSHMAMDESSFEWKRLGSFGTVT